MKGEYNDNVLSNREYLEKMYLNENSGVKKYSNPNENYLSWQIIQWT